MEAARGLRQDEGPQSRPFFMGARGSRARPQHPHAQWLLHAAGLGLGVVAPAPELVGAHRADDGGAGVLRHHGALQRAGGQRLGGVEPDRCKPRAAPTPPGCLSLFGRYLLRVAATG